MKKLALLLLLAGCAVTARAQIRVGEGQLSGSFETNSIYYVEDEKLGPLAAPPEDRFGSHNYLKLDYNYGRFSAGLQAEAYLPSLVGYDIGQYGKGHRFILASKYVQWQDKNFSIYVGDIYDQFGNGLIFRSWEDRALGFNNSVEGVRLTYRFNDYVHVKGLYGRPRLYDDYADSWVRGVDLSLSLADIAKWNEAMLTVEGSYVNRYESLEQRPELLENGMRPNINLYSGRLNFEYKGFSLRGEYAAKGDNDMQSPIDPSPKKGNVILGDIGFNHHNLGISATFRRLENMGTMLSVYGGGTGNVMNYLPALTRQYTYMLANLNPYVVVPEGEMGGQVDAYFSIRNSRDRARWWNFHANFSTFYTLKENGNGNQNLLWRDINVDVERQWNKRIKASLLYSRQQWNADHGATDDLIHTSNIFVGDVTYKFNTKTSIRIEAQYLLSNDYEKDWVAGLVELNFAPRWSIFFSDMYNHGSTEINYYNGGASYTRNRTRIQLSYGRNRAGYVCSGGVCRYQPAFTGLNLVLTSSF